MNAASSKYYQTRILELDKELKRVTRLTSKLYLVRLITFLIFVATLVLSFAGAHVALFVIVAALSLALFVAVVIYDMKMDTHKRRLEARINFNNGEIKTLKHEFGFREDGQSFSELNPHLSGDFDIFGVGSLYQYICRSVTFRGKRRFAASLVACELRCDKINERAEAVRELSAKMNFMESFVVVGSELRESGNEIDNLLAWLKSDNQREGFVNAVRFILPIITASVLMLSIFGYVSFASLSVMFILSLIAIHLNTKRLNQAHALLGRSAQTLGRYREMMEMIDREEFDSTLLAAERSKLATQGRSASESIRSLQKILDRFDYRFNVYVSIVLNGFLLFDYHTYIALLRWKREHGDVVARWFDAVTQIDSLIGLGVYAHNCSDTTKYAEIVDGDFKVSAEDMGHPLIAPERRVTNSIEILGRPSVVIITGANMAGKSTFLRTLAVNLILGMNGAPICAEGFIFSPVKIWSSIKIQDSLMNRESYFYAELLRLSEILEGVKVEPRSMIVLDEILRGTNTKDKQQGSLGLLRKIVEQRGVAIIATHDLVIGEMAIDYPDHVSNYCFEVEIDGEHLMFDYKLKSGISSKLNASFLMRRMGIID